MSHSPSDDLTPARALIAAGVPVFVAKPFIGPDGQWDPDAGTGGYITPPGWQNTPADLSTLDNYRPGYGLGAVMGHTVDALDTDKQHNGEVARDQLIGAGIYPTTYGTARTPSGGTHELIAPLHTGSRDGLRPGLDLKGGRPDGTGRGFIFIAPTVKRSKTTRQIEPYTWVAPPMLDELEPDDDTGATLAGMVTEALSPTAHKTSDTLSVFQPTGAEKHKGRLPEGQRHHGIVAYAGYLLKRGVGLDLAEQLMRVRLADCAQPPQATTPITAAEALGKLHDVYGRYAAGNPDLPTDPEDERAPNLRSQLLSLSDLSSLPPVRPLVDGLLYRDTLAQLSGPPGSYKTFLALGMALSVALGMDWEGHRVPEAGTVVYVAAEGATGLRARVLAWCELTNVDPADLDGKIYFLPVPIQLGNAVDVGQAVEMVQDLGAVLLVLDTRARCTLGLEENSATEQGKAVHNAEVIQRAAGCTVVGVHHSGRAGGAGRGSNSWDGGVWSDLRVTGEDLRARIHCEKHKDVPAGCDHEFRMVAHTVSVELMPGCTEAQRSTLVSVESVPIGGWDDLQSTPPSTRAVWDIIGTSDGIEGLTRPAIIALCKDHDISRTRAYEAVKALVTVGSLRNIGTEDKPRYVATSVTPREARQ